MEKTTASNHGLNEINSVCTNYQELIQSEDFKRVVKIAAKKGDYNKKVILSIFEKLGAGIGGDKLSEKEEFLFATFAVNKDVEAAVQSILAESPQSLSPQSLSPITENRFETIKNIILEHARVDVGKILLDTPKNPSLSARIAVTQDMILLDNEDEKLRKSGITFETGPDGVFYSHVGPEQPSKSDSALVNFLGIFGRFF